ncbi:MAG: DUF3987 domain-containing protein [Pseudomonadota bacterium]|nr:DUF3987 domain-containing protein [Pseudomonadota bacterium]
MKNNDSNWPSPPSEMAYWGLAGQIVKTIEPHTEADPVALLIQLLAAFGNVVGRNPCFMAEADRHGTNLFVVNVGLTAKGRKGVSWGHISRLFERVCPEWHSNNIKNGLASGEGVLWAIRDPVISSKDETTDAGVPDKRLLCIESEFATILKLVSREGNILSPILREAWDGKTLYSLTKNSPLKVTSPHISVIGHITKIELNRFLNQIEISNGLGNRFLFFCVHRSKCLPDGGKLEDRFIDQMADELRSSVKYSHEIKELKRNDEANNLWRSIYAKLSEGRMGIAGSILGRSEAQVMRLATITALLNRKSEITRECLEAALAIFEYCERSAMYLFGDSLGDPTADTLLFEIRNNPDGLSRTVIRDLFNRNKSKGTIEGSLRLLEQSGFIEKIILPGVKPTEIWIPVSTTKTTKTTDLIESSPPMSSTSSMSLPPGGNQ